MKKYTILFFVFVLLISGSLSAQNFQRGNGQFNAAGTISGSIIDSVTSKPIEYATISVMRNNDPKVITGSISDIQGKFIVEKVPFGPFKVKISFMGYNTLTKDSVIITPQRFSVNLGVIKISQKSVQLKGVEVTAQKGAVEFAIDKMVVNVEKTLPAAGGSVIDVLKNAPSVSVDMDNNVSLRGNTNLTILLDGHPSGVTDSKMLEQIPASAIEKIEVVTNPSAKYDADGTAGIINLIMKKQAEMNWNGMIQANAGTRDNYGSSVNLNFRQNKWNIFGSYDNRFNTRGMSATLDRRTTLAEGTSSTHQEMNGRSGGFSHNLKVGADYSINEQNSLNTTLLFNIGGGNFNHSAVSVNDGLLPGSSVTGYTTRNHSESNGQSLDYTLDYKKKFDKPDEELTADFYFSKSINSDSTDRDILNTYMAQNLSAGPEKQNTYSDNSNRLISFKTDFVSPVGEAGKFESGYKVIFRERNLNYNVENYDYSVNNWVNDRSQSNAFLYKEQIHAAYAMYSGQINKFKFQTGLRLEEALTRSVQQTLNNEYKKDYFSFIPTVHLSQELSEGQELKLSYSRRLNRPPLQMINPFIRYMDPQNAWAGNPYLKPEYTDSYEFGHNLIVNQSSLFSNVFYRRVHDNINQFTDLNENNVTVSTFRNIAGVTSYGIEFNGYTSLFKWWTLNGGYSYYGTKFDPNTPGLSNTSTSRVWNARLTSMIILGWDMDLQFNCFYMSKNVTPQGNSKGMFFSDLGLKKSFLERKLSVSLRVNDVFNAMRFRNETLGTNFSAVNNFKPQSQIFTLSFQYNINNYSPNRDRRPEDDNGAREYENVGQNR
ncbi:MAG TPA: outer membrane beta-barrel family protein [Ignavibacteriales bacterium]|nr:outer membrane beta-barrel family protein [Ignavibacteriales bacterium]